jgi:hypothetical protein
MKAGLYELFFKDLAENERKCCNFLKFSLY